MLITLKSLAEEPFRNEDGSWSFEIPSTPLSDKDVAVLDRLFPDLASAVGRLLAKQALFDRIQ